VTTDDTEPVESLRRLSLFTDLDDAALARIAEVATPTDVPSGYVLMEAGQEGSGLFVIQEGRVSVELRSRTIECGAGEFLGELSLLVDGLVHTGRVRAATPVKFLAISRRDFEQLLDREPRVAVNMLRVLARRLADTDRMFAHT
jgi:CRP-like cAMP-binding protein